VHGQPFLIVRDHTPAMAALVERTLGRGSWDAVHADQLWMAPYAEQPRPGLVRVLDQHNAVFRIPAQLADRQPNPVLRRLLRWESSKLERFERATLDRFDRVVWVTGEDRSALRHGGDRGRDDFLIPIAIDPSDHQPLVRERPFRVTFLGGIHWPPNAEAVRWFADRVWPRVTAEVPGAVFTVIGKGNAGPMPGASRIETAGYVADPSSLLAETAVFVVPLLAGAGMRVKILEAWCRALPVVSTSIGAEGLRAGHGENLLLADEPAAFAAHVVRLIQSGSEAARLGANGRSTVESFYDWRTVYKAWDQIYR
jgi:glycosyltransferase involved in cell wall biosynthesis